jgi:hypothetical protein
VDFDVYEKDHYFIMKNEQYYNDEAERKTGLAAFRLRNETQEQFRNHGEATLAPSTITPYTRLEHATEENS